MILLRPERIDHMAGTILRDTLTVAVVAAFFCGLRFDLMNHIHSILFLRAQRSRFFRRCSHLTTIMGTFSGVFFTRWKNNFCLIENVAQELLCEIKKAMLEGRSVVQPIGCLLGKNEKFTLRSGRDIEQNGMRFDSNVKEKPAESCSPPVWVSLRFYW